MLFEPSIEPRRRKSSHKAQLPTINSYSTSEHRGKGGLFLTSDYLLTPKKQLNFIGKSLNGSTMTTDKPPNQKNIRTVVSPTSLNGKNSTSSPLGFSMTSSQRVASLSKMIPNSSNKTLNGQSPPRSSSNYWLNPSAVSLEKHKTWNNFSQEFWIKRKLENFLSLEEETQGPFLKEDDFLKTEKVDVQNLENWCMEKRLGMGQNSQSHKEDKEQEKWKPNLQSEIDRISDKDDPQLNVDLINLVLGESFGPPPSPKKKDSEKILSSDATVKYIRSYKKYMNEAGAPTASNRIMVGAKQTRKGPETIERDLNRFILNEMVGEKLRKEMNENPPRVGMGSKQSVDKEKGRQEQKLALVNPAKTIWKKTIGNFFAFKNMNANGVIDELSMDYLLKVVRANSKKKVKNELNFSQEYKEYLQKNGAENGEMSLQALESLLLNQFRKFTSECKANKTAYLDRVNLDLQKNALMKSQIKIVNREVLLKSKKTGMVPEE